MTSISPDSSQVEHLPTIHSDVLFIKSTNNDLITFAKENRLKLDLFSTYIFTDAEGSDIYSGKLVNNARVLISFVAPTSGQKLILRLKHSGENGSPSLEVTLLATVFQLDPSSESPTIDNITLVGKIKISISVVATADEYIRTDHLLRAAISACCQIMSPLVNGWYEQSVCDQCLPGIHIRRLSPYIISGTSHKS